MDKLANYGSDDEYEDSPRAAKEYQDRHHSIGHHQKASDANYDEVGMDLSEDSSDGSTPTARTESRSKPSSEKRKKDRSSPKSRDRRDDRRNGDHRERLKDKDDKHGRDKEERDDRRHAKDKEDRHGRDRHSEDRHGRDKTRNKDERDDKHGRDKDREDRDKYNEDRDDKYRDRRYGRSDRSRSPRSNRRRSSSRERAGLKYIGGGGGGYSRRHDKATNKMAHLEKMGIEIKPANNQYVPSDNREPKTGAGDDNKFFHPGVTGRVREQMERRKLLWQKKEPEKTVVAASPIMLPSAAAGSSSKTGKVWEATTFAQDQDGKQASKFKRLMGIKDASAEGPRSASDVAKKQEELFSTMEQQYEVARTATHTMRGVGLGFGSFQR